MVRYFIYIWILVIAALYLVLFIYLFIYIFRNKLKYLYLTDRKFKDASKMSVLLLVFRISMLANDWGFMGYRCLTIFGALYVWLYSIFIYFIKVSLLSFVEKKQK